ncbi:MAG: hypothetical protein JO138_24465 [Acidobacteriaceae bacterium]|nr:hypothetical protein [Acidobacteriaceae bacterium]
MHTLLRSRIALGILTLSTCQGFAHPRPPKVISGPPLVIRVYSLPDIPPRTLNQAMHDAARILATAAVDAMWQQGRAGAPESRIVDQSFPVLGKNPGYQARGYIVVVIVRGVPARCFPGALGYALPHARVGANATIFYDRIERLTEPGGIELSTALGCAVAHEIGHVLLGSTEHSHKGIMKGVWNAGDFRMSSLAAVGFTASQRLAIQKRLSIEEIEGSRVE